MADKLEEHINFLRSHDDVNDASIKEILQNFVLSLKNCIDGRVRKKVMELWEILHQSELYISLTSFPSESKQHVCLFTDFLENCFDNLRLEETMTTMFIILEKSGAVCLKALVKSKNMPAVYEVILFFFVKLINSSDVASQNMVKLILESSAWTLNDAIVKMLSNYLVKEGYYDVNFNLPTNVYHLIYELTLINKDLTVGLLNNTTLCLMPGRSDRIVGLEFLCKLFSQQNIPGILRPTDYFSNIWQTFLIQTISLINPKEMETLAEHTSLLLSKPDTSLDWCKLLFHILKHKIPEDVMVAFVSGVTGALKENLNLLGADGPRSLCSLVKNLLTPGSQYELQDEARKLLINDLGRIYEESVKYWVANQNFQKFLDATSKILDCLLGTCESLMPTIEKWTVLRKIFVKKLVPFKQNPSYRMKMLLYFWMNSCKHWDILHELFQKSAWSRSRILHLIQVMRAKNISMEERKRSVIRYLYQLSAVLDSSSHFLSKEFLPAVRNSAELRSYLIQLTSGETSCEDNQRICGQVRDLINTPEHMEVLDRLVYFVTEVTCDKESIKYLIELVETCVKSASIAKSLSLPRLYVARSSLQLLNEMLFMCPRLGLEAVVLDHLHGWACSKNGSLSALSLRCMLSIAPFKLEALKFEFSQEMLPLWIHFIESESRGQVKMAIRCIAVHLIKSRNEMLTKVFHIISSQLAHPSRQEAFERGVSAIGHFAEFCPMSLKADVRKLCFSVLLQKVVLGLDEENNSESSFSVASSDTWVDWKELPYSVSIKVQALRSIGRCMRYCGSFNRIEEAFESLEEILSNSAAKIVQREVDIDRLRYEAASAILNICEVAEFQSKISAKLILSLSQLMIDRRPEVKISFLEKLCQGLTPHKFRSINIGRSRGNLPPSMLGLLALLGSNAWSRECSYKEEAEKQCKRVFLSQHIFAEAFSVYEQVKFEEFYCQNSRWVLENILATGLPILAEQLVKLVEIESPDNTVDLSLDSDSVKEVGYCIHFLLRMICHPDTFGIQVSKSYLTDMAQVAKHSIITGRNEEEIMKFGVATEVLELVVTRYNPRKKGTLSPTVQLPQPFYLIDGQTREIDNDYRLAPSLRKVIEKSVFGANISKNVSTGELSKETDQSKDSDQSTSDDDTSVNDSPVSSGETSKGKRNPEYSSSSDADHSVDRTYQWAPAAQSTPL